MRRKKPFVREEPPHAKRRERDLDKEHTAGGTRRAAERDFPSAGNRRAKRIDRAGPKPAGKRRNRKKRAQTFERGLTQVGLLTATNRVEKKRRTLNCSKEEKCKGGGGDGLQLGEAFLGPRGATRWGNKKMLG